MIVTRLYLLLLLILTSSSGCAILNLGGIQPPSVTLLNLVPGRMNLFAQEFQLEILIQNPNAVVLPLQGMSYTLQINNQKFASGVSNTVNNIPAFSQQAVTISVTTGLGQIFQQLHNALNNKQNQSFSYQLTGKLHLSNLNTLNFTTHDTLQFQDK
jgi:LEA14-like dessication related protein